MTPHPTPKKAPRLLQQVRERIRALHYSYRTAQVYVHWIRHLILFHTKRRPREMGKSGVKHFLTHLASVRKVSASTQNQALSALLFLYKQVLEIEIGWIEDVVRAKQSTRVPVVLTRDEKQWGQLFSCGDPKKPLICTSCDPIWKLSQPWNKVYRGNIVHVAKAST